MWTTKKHMKRRRCVLDVLISDWFADYSFVVPFFCRWWYRSICTLRIFGLHSTHAITAPLSPIISKNCSVSV